LHPAPCFFWDCCICSCLITAGCCLCCC
jgi:hypothetical protein